MPRYLRDRVQAKLRPGASTETLPFARSESEPMPRSAGGGQSLPQPVRRSMQSRFDADFSEVRVHDDGNANAAAGALQARAFTAGRDVVFASGEFRPGTSTGDRLIAHELAHVVQQSAGGAGRATVGNEHDPAEGRADAAADAAVSGRPVPDVGSAGDAAVQRAPVASMGGSFDTILYAPVSAPTGAVGERLGANMRLEFTANDLVESTKIGLIQSTKAMTSSKAGGPRDTVTTGVGDADEGQLIMGPKQADPGREIDVPVHPGGRAAPSTSPIYGVGHTTGGMETTLSQGTPTIGSAPTGSQWGSHTKDPASHTFLPAVPARIEDGPNRTIGFAGQTFEHTFEVAALAVEGPIPVNTYLGSVSWGWRSDAAGQVTVDPVTLVGAGTPSAKFMGAAELWNAASLKNTATGAAVPSVDIPITTLNSGTTLPASRTTTDLVIQIAKLNAELGSMLPGPDKTNKEFEKKALEFELAKRANQPTISLANQEKAAALLTTPNLIRRADALRTEVPGAPAGTAARTDKELELEAVKREIAKRRILITVHVHDTEDIIGSDSVYVTASSLALSTRTSMVDLNNGQEHTFVVPLSALLPLPPLSMSAASVFFKVFDSDWEGDDLMFDKDWMWTDLPASSTQSRDGGKYTVSIDFAQIR